MLKTFNVITLTLLVSCKTTNPAATKDERSSSDKNAQSNQEDQSEKNWLKEVGENTKEQPNFGESTNDQLSKSMHESKKKKLLDLKAKSSGTNFHELSKPKTSIETSGKLSSIMASSNDDDQVVEMGQIYCKGDICKIRTFDLDRTILDFPPSNEGWRDLELEGTGNVQSIASYKIDDVYVHWYVRDDGFFYSTVHSILDSTLVETNRYSVEETFVSNSYVDSLDFFRMDGSVWVGMWQNDRGYVLEIQDFYTYYWGPTPYDWKEIDEDSLDRIPGSGKVTAQTLYKSTDKGIQGVWRWDSGGHVRRLELDNDGGYIFPDPDVGWDEGTISHSTFEPDDEKVNALSLWDRDLYANLEDWNYNVIVPNTIHPDQDIFAIDDSKQYFCIMARPGNGNPKNGHSILFFIWNGWYDFLQEHPFGVTFTSTVIPRIYLVSYYKHGQDPALLCKEYTREMDDRYDSIADEVMNPEPGDFQWLTNNCTDYAAGIFEEVTGVALRRRLIPGVPPSIPGILADSIRAHSPASDELKVDSVRSVLGSVANNLGVYIVE